MPISLKLILEELNYEYDSCTEESGNPSFEYAELLTERSCEEPGLHLIVCLLRRRWRCRIEARASISSACGTGWWTPWRRGGHARHHGHPQKLKLPSCITRCSGSSRASAAGGPRCSAP